MTAALATLIFEPYGRDVVFSDWIGDDGNPYVISDFGAELQVRADIDDVDALISLSTQNGKIVITSPTEITAAFSDEDVAALYCLPVRSAIASSLPALPRYRVAMFELRLISSGALPYSVVQGDCIITLGVVK